MKFEQTKALEMSQSISAIYDDDASLSEICAATALALCVRLDNEADTFTRAFFIVNFIKHLTMDHKGRPTIIRPINGD